MEAKATMDKRSFLQRKDEQSRLPLDHLLVTEIDQLRALGALVEDPEHLRPRYFDGRFLAARDLQADQSYFLARQRELAQISGSGIVSGLLVTRADDFRVTIDPGVGVTPGGELVVLIPSDGESGVTVNLADVASTEQLDGAFGLLDTPRAPARNRSGLFVLALRPVEYTANPIGSYPTSIEERRKPMDSDIVEATAITLIPIQDPGFESRPAQQRALAARRIFVDSAGAVALDDVVPIAIVQLQTGFLRWVDNFLVRREIGAEHAGVGGFGASPRAIREAFLQQYQDQLRDVLDERQRAGSSLRFAASEVFRALPPAGQLPAAALDSTAATQLWFPAAVQAAQVTLPEDELAALIDESLLLEPIDLQASAEELARISVLIVTTAARSSLAGGVGSGAVQPLTSAMPVVLPPASNVLRLLSTGGFQSLRPALTVGSSSAETGTGDAPTAPAEAAPTPPELRWYVRRRLLHTQPSAAVIVASTGT